MNDTDLDYREALIKFIKKARHFKTLKRLLLSLEEQLCDGDFEWRLSEHLEHLGGVVHHDLRFVIGCTQVSSMIVRDSAVQALGGCKLKDRKIDRALAQRLEDKSWVVRCSAAYALGERRALHYTQKIVDRYKSWSFIEKQWVLMALAKMEDPATLDFLTRIYRRSSNRDRKYLAAAGLSVLGLNEPRLYLESKYAGTTDPEEKFNLKNCMDLVREAEITGT